MDFIFGIHSVEEALRAGKAIEKILIHREHGVAQMRTIFELAKEQDIVIQKVPTEKLNRLCRKNHQGVIAFMSVIDYAPLENVVAHLFEQGKNPFLLILDGITDVRNLGAIARSAECNGANGLIIPAKGSAPINSDAMKTSAGALNFLPVSKENVLGKTIRYLQDCGIKVVACTEKAEKNIHEIDLSVPVAIVMGSEDEGISTEVIRKADELAKIQMHGQVSSLNVAVAAGIICYETAQQRSKNNG